MSQDDSVVFIVDDDASIRDSLESLFRSIGHETQTFESTDGFLQADRPDLPGCLVLDVRLRGRSGLTFLNELVQRGLVLPVVFITGHGDVQMSVTAMKAGAIEFLTKPFRHQDLLDAVHRGIEIDKEHRQEAAAGAAMRDRYATLTPREREVMAMVTAGLLNKQIAAALELSEVTVKVHRGQVMRKMHAQSLPELVRIADRLAATTQRA